MWTKKLPKKEGYYWFYGSYEDDDKYELYHVELIRKNKQLFVLVNNSCIELDDWKGDYPVYAGYWQENIAPDKPKVKNIK